MLTYVPIWEVHNNSAHKLVGFTKAFFNLSRGRVQYLSNQ